MSPRDQILLGVPYPKHPHWERFGHAGLLGMCDERYHSTSLEGDAFFFMIPALLTVHGGKPRRHSYEATPGGYLGLVAGLTIVSICLFGHPS